MLKMLKTVLKNGIAKTLVISTALFAVQNAVAAEENPYALTQQASDKLFTAMKANQAAIKQNPDSLKGIVRQTLMPYVHVNYAGSLVLGQYFKTTTPEQREKFFTAFDKFIEQAYAQALTLYTDQQIEVEKEKAVSGSLVNVRVKLIQTNGKAPINLNFYWRKNSKSGKWQVYDMASEGVSMVETKKQEWNNILRKEGIEALTRQVERAANAPVTLSK